MSADFNKKPEDNQEGAESGGVYPVPPQGAPSVESNPTPFSHDETRSEPVSAAGQYQEPSVTSAHTSYPGPNSGSSYPNVNQQNPYQQAPYGANSYPGHPGGQQVKTPEEEATLFANWSLGLAGGAFLMYLFALFTFFTGFLGLAANIVGIVLGSMAAKRGNSTGKIGMWLNIGLLALSTLITIGLILLLGAIFMGAASEGYNNY